MGAIAGTLIAIVGLILLQVVYGVVMGFQMRGSPPQEMLIAAFARLPFLVLASLFALLGGIIGGRMAALPLEGKYTVAGLITGVLVAILVAIWRSISWGIDLWVAVYAVVAVIGGWIGGQLAERRAAREMDIA